MRTVAATIVLALASPAIGIVPEHHRPPKAKVPSARQASPWVAANAVNVQLQSIGSTCWVTVTRLQPEVTDDELRQIARRRISDWLRQRHVSLRECSVNIETRCDESVLLTVYY